MAAELLRPDKGAAVALCAAFHDYPVMRFVLRDSGAMYDAHLPELIGFFCESRLCRGWPLLGIRRGGDLVAVAALNPAEGKPRPRSLQRIYGELARSLGRASIERLAVSRGISRKERDS